VQSGASGSVWRINLTTGESQLLCDRMAFPFGIVLAPTGGILVSESWRHRILDLSAKQAQVVVDDLPFYPARLSLTSLSEVLVCGFAPRFQLFEFILRKGEFLRRMTSEVPERYWMAPALSSGGDYWEPTQRGQIRQDGTQNPWSPTRSYGLLATMDLTGRFLRSGHSRAGGIRHGITSALECGSQILMSSKGGGLILAMEGVAS
jgi:hypothetical protein